MISIKIAVLLLFLLLLFKKTLITDIPICQERAINLSNLLYKQMEILHIIASQESQEK